MVRNILLKEGSKNLTLEQRCDFSRLLLSLDMRRPAIVEKLRNEGAKTYRADIDSDSKILAAMSEAEIEYSSAFQAEKFVFSIDAFRSRWLHKYLKPKL